MKDEQINGQIKPRAEKKERKSWQFMGQARQLWGCGNDMFFTVKHPDSNASR